MRNILILFAHPAFHKSIINRALLDAVRGLENVTINELYENYPDFFIDVEKEKKLLQEHDVIVWHHPFYWYSAPAIIKEWMDLVLQHGFAYGRNGFALQGKWAMSAVSTGGRQEVYTATGANHFSVNQFLAPVNQTATLCRMRYLPPFVTHGAHTITEAEIKKQAAVYREVITGLRDNKYGEKDFKNIEYSNHLTLTNA